MTCAKPFSRIHPKYYWQFVYPGKWAVSYLNICLNIRSIDFQAWKLFKLTIRFWSKVCMYIEFNFKNNDLVLLVLVFLYLWFIYLSPSWNLMCKCTTDYEVTRALAGLNCSLMDRKTKKLFRIHLKSNWKLLFVFLWIEGFLLKCGNSLIFVHVMCKVILWWLDWLELMNSVNNLNSENYTCHGQNWIILSDLQSWLLCVCR